MSMRHLVFLLVLTAPITAFAQQLQVTESPTKKPRPKSLEAISQVRTAIDICKTNMTAHSDTSALISDDDYFTYTAARDAAAVAEPTILVFDASLDYHVERTPSKWFPKCTTYYANYASGVGAADLALTPLCHGRVDPLFKWTASALADYQATASQAAHGKLGGARGQLETLRFALFKTGNAGPIGHCSINDRFKKAWAPLKQQFDTLEAQIIAAETAKGVQFVSTDNGPTNPAGYKYLDKNGQPASPIP